MNPDEPACDEYTAYVYIASLRSWKPVHTQYGYHPTDILSAAGLSVHADKIKVRNHRTDLIFTYVREGWVLAV